MTFTSIRIRTGWVFAERAQAEQAAPELQQELRALLAAPEVFVMPDTDFDAANLRAHRVPRLRGSRPDGDQGSSRPLPHLASSFLPCVRRTR